MAETGPAPTLREVYGLVEQVKVELLAEVRRVETLVDAKLQTHQSEHIRDRDHRASLYRWGVTSIISALGVLIAIYFAVKGQL